MRGCTRVVPLFVFRFLVVDCLLTVLEPSTYNDLLDQNITKSCKKAQPNTTRAIHSENKNIATKLGIDDRVDTAAKKDAFITLKDHKPNLKRLPGLKMFLYSHSQLRML